MSVINTNLSSLTTQKSLKQNQSSLSTSMERLSSGLRVNSAKDDAAGQAIGNRLQAQRLGLGRGARNANDGISLSQTAHDVLDSINEKLQRVRELTVQSLNSGVLKTSDRDFIQAEINQNLMEIDRLAETSQFNGIPLMTGQAGRVDLQIGANDGQQLSVDLSPPGFSVDALGLTDFNVAGEPGTVTPRDMLFGPADDIVLEDSRTTLNYPTGAEETLYALGDVSLAGDHQREPGAISTYYV
ncbi:flagellin, partial [Lamprobacter modestohalophilus]|nr:flagellin [Lamprobacter modestohalophilus]